jgi:hypothetical protein
MAYVRWAPSSDATQTLTEARGVSSVTRSAIGEYTITLTESCKALVAFPAVIDNSTTSRSFVRVESTSASAGTVSIKHVVGAGNVAVSAELTDISTASSAFVASPIAGTITSIRTVLHSAISGADAVLTTEINGAAVTNSSITVAQSGSAAGDRDSATPTAANTVAVGDAIELITDGASTTAARLTATYIITPTVGSDTVDEIECVIFCRKFN